MASISRDLSGVVLYGRSRKCGIDGNNGRSYLLKFIRLWRKEFGLGRIKGEQKVK